jgi:CDP-diglyceride synthetase
MPKISPKKTWAGLIGGYIITFIIPNLIFIIMLNHIVLSAFAIIMGFYLSLIGVIGQVGDLMESYFIAPTCLSQPKFHPLPFAPSVNHPGAR